MNNINSFNQKKFSFINSPLEQFCDEETDLDSYGKQSLLGHLDTFDLIDELLIMIAMTLSVLASLLLIYNINEGDENTGNEWDENGVMLATNQTGILSANILGAVPGYETQTAELSLALFYSFTTVIVCIIIGFVIHGIRYLSVIFPGGMYLVMAPFILAIEFISFSARAISLGMRLFANMFAGHSLFKILYAFSWVILISAFAIFSLIILTVIFALIILEMGIAYLQGYVYGSLSSMYLSETVSLAH